MMESENETNLKTQKRSLVNGLSMTGLSTDHQTMDCRLIELLRLNNLKIQKLKNLDFNFGVWIIIIIWLSTGKSNGNVSKKVGNSFSIHFGSYLGAFRIFKLILISMKIKEKLKWTRLIWQWGGSRFSRIRYYSVDTDAVW